MAKKPGFSWERHLEVGKQLKTISGQLLKLSTEIANTYPIQSKATRRAKSAYKKVLDLRCEMDNVVGHDCSNKTDSELNKVYYGSEEEQTAQAKKTSSNLH